MTTLHHCIYASAATYPFNAQSLALLLRKAQANNQRLGITGMLLYVDGSFLQVLEGRRDDIETVLGAISADPRHAKIARIIDEPIAVRSFAEWSMGYAQVTRRHLGELGGPNEFFGRASCFDRVEQGSAKKLVAAFRDGRWRSRLASSPTPMTEIAHA
jgi:hypothetical protein